MEFWQDNNSHEGVWLAVYCWFDNLMQDNHIENTYKLVHTNIVLQRPVWRCTTTQWRKHLPVCCTVCTRSPQPANWGKTSALHIAGATAAALSHTQAHTHTHTCEVLLQHTTSILHSSCVHVSVCVCVSTHELSLFIQQLGTCLGPHRWPSALFRILLECVDVYARTCAQFLCGNPV